MRHPWQRAFLGITLRDSHQLEDLERSIGPSIPVQNFQPLSRRFFKIESRINLIESLNLTNILPCW